MHDFDTDVYNTSPSSLIYKLVDALCGSTGAGQLLNENFINVLQGDLNTTYGSDLDYFFGNIGFLPRSPAEMYTANSSIDLLTSGEWDRIRVKDAWYRARIRNFWTACGMGGTSEAIRLICIAACSCDANVYEAWRFFDNFGITDPIGRADARNEVVVQPLKSSLSQQEFRLLRDMLSRVMPLETIVTINTQGLAVLHPVPISSACASSTHFEVQRVVTATPTMQQLPPASQLPITLLPSEQWLYDAQVRPQLAPHPQFLMAAHYSQYYVTGGGTRSPIDSITYGTLNSDGSVSTVSNFAAYHTNSQFTPWAAWEKADSPDNYPGGKFGIHPSYAPAINSDGTTYNFTWTSQEAYVTAQTAYVEGLGGNANINGYQMPVAATNQTQLVFFPEYAIAQYPPGRDSTVSASLTRKRQVQESGTQGWTSTAGFVRS